MAYTTTTDVSRILRSQAQRRINFTGYYRNLKPSEDNTSSIYLTRVNFLPTYDLQETVTIRFVDTTAYSVSSINLAEGDRASTFYGYGDIYTNFTSSTGIIIDATNWANIPAVANDVISFETEVHMSLSDLEGYIEDASYFIDGYLRRYLMVSEDTTSLFDIVPYEIKYAATRLTAFFVFSDLFNLNLSGMRVQPEDINERVVVNNWYKQAITMLDKYIEFHQHYNNISAPRWFGRRRLLKNVGIAGVGKGIAVPKIDDAPTTLNSDYDDLLDLYADANFTDEVEE